MQNQRSRRAYLTNEKENDMIKSTKKTLAKMAAVMALAGLVGTTGSAQEDAMGTDLEKLNWVERGPVLVVPLWGDDSGESAFLLRNKPGYAGAMHTHSEDYHGVTLQGTWLKKLDDDSVTEIPLGSHILQAKREWHQDGCAGPEDCILFIHFEGPRDVFFPEN